jgi:MoxR-like ATPase
LRRDFGEKSRLTTSALATEKKPDLRSRIIDEVSKVVVGRQSELNLLLICLLAKGHVLLEGVPGISKTLLAKAFSRCLDLKFKRVQFTPDMLPLDIVGGYIFNMKTREFEFKEGPIFANILLADEINRAAPKVQSALLESMQELQVTVEGYTSKLPTPFMVIATQNPLDFEGVYPLPESQLDRFMMKVGFGYPSSKIESDILRRNLSEIDVDVVSPIVGPNELEQAFTQVDAVQVSPEILDYVVKLGESTRVDTRISLGASPRAMVQLVHSARANAVLDGRDYVTPEDVKFVAPYVLAHRIRIDRAASLKGLAGSSNSVINELLDVVKPPR